MQDNLPLRAKTADEVGIVQHTFLGFWLNGALGSGRYDNISIEDVKRELDKGTIFAFLKDRLGADIDLEILSAIQLQKIADEWKDVAFGERLYKFGVQRGGLCLLVALVLECVQRRVPAASD